MFKTAQQLSGSGVGGSRPSAVGFFSSILFPGKIKIKTTTREFSASALAGHTSHIRIMQEEEEKKTNQNQNEPFEVPGI